MRLVYEGSLDLYKNNKVYRCVLVYGWSKNLVYNVRLIDAIFCTIEAITYSII